MCVHVTIPGEPRVFMLRGERISAGRVGEIESVALGRMADGRAEVRELYTSGAVSHRIASLYVWQIAELERNGFRCVTSCDVASVWVAA